VDAHPHRSHHREVALERRGAEGEDV
jgi:hypothetical protein